MDTTTAEAGDAAGAPDMSDRLQHLESKLAEVVEAQTTARHDISRLAAERDQLAKALAETEQRLREATTTMGQELFALGRQLHANRNESRVIGSRLRDEMLVEQKVARSRVERTEDRFEGSLRDSETRQIRLVAGLREEAIAAIAAADDAARLATEGAIRRLGQRGPHNAAGTAASEPKADLAVSSDVADLARRITAVNAVSTRRLVELERQMAEVGTAQPPALPSPARTTPAPAQPATPAPVGRNWPADAMRQQVERALAHEANAGVRERRANRMVDLAGLVAEPFLPLRDNDTADALRARGYRLQLGELWQAGQTRDYRLACPPGVIIGADLALGFLFPPPAQATIFHIAVMAPGASDRVLRKTVLEIDAASPHVPTPLRFEPVEASDGGLVLRFAALPDVLQFGVSLYEWRAISLFRRRIRDRVLFARPVAG